MAEAQRPGVLEYFRTLPWLHVAALACAYLAILGALGPWGADGMGYGVISLDDKGAHVLPVGWLIAALAFGGLTALALFASNASRGIVGAALFGIAFIIAAMTWQQRGWEGSWGLPLAAAASLAGAALAGLGVPGRSETKPTMRPWIWELQFLLLLGAFMLWIRMLPYASLVATDRVYYIGTDPYYHFRETLGIVRSFPDVPRFDPFTHYPHGTTTGQFGSLFDWTAAAYVVATAGRGASEAYIAQVLGGFPAFVGAALIIPFYYLAKRLFGMIGAVVATGALTMMGGEFLIRSIAGYADHHVMEAMMAIVTMLGVVVAVERAHAARADTIWREPRTWWRSGLWGVAGGVAIWLNFLAWPPALLFCAILFLWLTIILLLEDARGGDARGILLGGVVPLVLSGLLMAPFVETMFLGEFNTYGILQVVAPIAMAVALVLIHVAVRALAGPDDPPEARQRASWIVAGGLALLGVIAFFATKIVSPAVYGAFRWGLSWVTGIGVPRTTLTISEAQGSDIFCSYRVQESCLGERFGYIPQVTGLILFALLAFAIWKRRRTDILLLLWSAVIFLATATQVRFSYYLGVNMALLIGWAGARLAEAVAFRPAENVALARKAAKAKALKAKRAATPTSSFRQTAPVRSLVGAVVLIVVLPGNAYPFMLHTGSRDVETPPGGNCQDKEYQCWVFPAWARISGFGPDGDLVMWIEELEWMRANTPDAGVRLEDVIEAPAPGTHYQQAPESYGVLSWWDYGHWMEVVARRAPVANPFQQAAPFASCWLTERNETRAEAMLALWSQREYVRPEGTACKDVQVDTSELWSDENKVRYVMIDDDMAAGKFGAITVWANCDECLWYETQLKGELRSREEYLRAQFRHWKEITVPGKGVRELPWNGPGYHETMLARLYVHDGAELGHYRLVHESPRGSVVGWVAGISDTGDLFIHNNNQRLSERFARSPGEWNSRITSAQLTDDGRYIYDHGLFSAVKTFEHVKGAQVVGTAAAGATVQIRVDLVNNETKREFSWRDSVVADASGAWRLSVPYATTDLVAVAEGGTNYGIVARGPATLIINGVATASVNVPDRHVLDGSEIRVGS